MSAVIIQFIPRPKHHHEATDFPTIAFRSAVPNEPARDTPAKHDLDTGHADTSPCEYVRPDWFEK